MQSLRFATVAVSLLSSVAAFTPASTSGTDALNAEGLIKLSEYQALHASSTNCTLENSYARKEWSALTDSEKKAYLDAVLCLQSEPSLTGDSIPGAKSRFDDFVGIHINKTSVIHNTGNFLSWHRYFIYTYEQALRNECNYTGYQPYVNWGMYAEDLGNAPIFDGSDTSLGGNGLPVNNSGVYLPSSSDRKMHLPSGTGGGCITSGPFANMSVNVGPFAPILDDVPANPQADGLGYNPRCLRRDLGLYGAKIGSTDLNSTNLISNYDDVLSFQNSMQGDFANQQLGVHAAGHYWVSGDPGGDVFSSPGDPFFYFHHAQIDRTWWIWQNQDLATRQNAIAGTITMNNSPPSRNATLNDTVELGILAPSLTIADLMSTFDGPFCYRYL